MDQKNMADRRVMAACKNLAHLRAIKEALEETIDLALLELEEARNVRAEINLDGVGSVAVLAALPPDSTGSPPPQGLQDRP